MNVLLGLDFGTTNFKAVIYDYSGHLVKRFEQAVTTRIDALHHEQNPASLADLAASLLREAYSYCQGNNFNLLAIGLSAAMHGIILTDADDMPLTNLLVFSDQRSYEEVATLKNSDIGESIFANSGTPLHTMLPVAKLMWIKKHQPELFNRANKITSFKGYLMRRWFGKYVCDPGIAAASGMYHFSKNDWNPDIISFLSIHVHQLEHIVAADSLFNDWRADFVNLYKLHDLPPVVIGSSDGCLALLGVGAVHRHEASLTIGTSAAIRVLNDQAKPDPGKSTFVYPLHEHAYVSGAPVNNGGAIVNWLKNLLKCDEKAFWKLFDDALTTLPPGSEGLQMIPYLSGERAPLWNANLTGAFLGIRAAHRDQHFVKAAVEAIGYNLNENLQVLNEVQPIKRMLADGGFTRSRVWVQLLANILDRDLEIAQEENAAARGAAIMAKAALEHLPLLGEVFNRPAYHLITPNRHEAEIYSDLKRQYLMARDLMLANQLL